MKGYNPYSLYTLQSPQPSLNYLPFLIWSQGLSLASTTVCPKLTWVLHGWYPDRKPEANYMMSQVDNIHPLIRWTGRQGENENLNLWNTLKVCGINKTLKYSQWNLQMYFNAVASILTSCIQYVYDWSLSLCVTKSRVWSLFSDWLVCEYIYYWIVHKFLDNYII